MKLKQTIMALALAACPLVANADYPIFWQRYTADPSAFVWNGRLYIFCSHDTYETVRGYNYFMNDVTCISTTDMKNWTDHGEVFSYKNSKWGAKMTWAPQVIERNGKFYLYYGDGGNAIGVAVADNPIGPYVDERTTPLVSHDTPGVDLFDRKGNELHPLPGQPGALGGAENWGLWCFDPTAFVDKDGQAYLYFGGAHPENSRIIKLKENMVETDGRAIHPNTPGFFEASWVHYYNRHYYYSYAGHGFNNPANIEYVMSDNPMYGFTNPAIALPNPPDNEGYNNHHSIVEYRGKWYMAYHNRTVVHRQLEAANNGVTWCKAIDGVNDHRAHEYMRSVCIDELTYNADGTIKTVTPTEDGLKQLEYVDPYKRQEAEMMAKGWGIVTADGATGRYVMSQHKGDYTLVRGVDFGNGCAKSLSVSVKGKGKIEVHLDSRTGKRLASLSVSNASQWTTVKASCANIKGLHDLYFIFSNANSSIDWWKVD